MFAVCLPTSRILSSRQVAPSRSTVRLNATALQRKIHRMSKMNHPSNQLERLQQLSTVVADTGDVSQIKKYKPVDCTTNPSLVLKVVDSPMYEDIIKEALQEERANPELFNPEHPYAGVVDRLSVGIGAQLLKVIPGSVSTECDARLAYDTQATIDKGRRLIGLYSSLGYDVDRVYVKIAATWEGVKAAEQLQREGIRCNMTLLFSFPQAVACALVRASLISPFVGRILDWYRAKEGRDYAAEEDPGVASVRRIYCYYKRHGYSTSVMAASFRNVGEILALAGCDLLTVSPALLQELADSDGDVPHALSATTATEDSTDEYIPKMDEELFRSMLAEDTMATEKLAEGVSNFAEDQAKCEARLAEKAAEWGLTIEQFTYTI